ncbi:GGDEF domain-containing protein [Desulfohalobium retbaense]|uniref:diguanylate cyclase n=1 Tax=Desulfohalobium retbaense (strain ATCC 49708 / DSM 5692 / JCM 16813 / HR100) TaxID=485915 RepID=C8X3T4_DESRD|nr:sensor domain-containing diguanylate cyclase [Desulfohalobium retbaense]ACV69081.1 diguanylate cyclase with PAS/PAC sensor [Desulfohalobium retbaense DSM 5692]
MMDVPPNAPKTDLDEAFQQFLAVQEAFPDPILVVNEDGVYEAVMGGQARGLYDSGHNLVGHAMHDVLPQEKADWFLQVVRQALNEHELQIVEYALSPDEVIDSPSDGPEHAQWFEGRVYPIHRPAGQKQAVVWVVLNMTKRKKLFEELQAQSERDALTGVYNRLAFTRYFDQYKYNAQRYRRPLSLLVLDLDEFKGLNDRFGHAAGDVVLQSLAEALRSRLRQTDILARLGGDEFAILLPETPYGAAVELMGRLRKALNAMIVPFESEEIPVRVSLGVSTLSLTDKEFEELFARADANMYKHKRIRQKKEHQFPRSAVPTYEIE